MKITIYELLGLVKDGKAPKIIKLRNEIFEYKSNIENGFIDYVGTEKETNTKFYLSSYIGNNYANDIFTDEVEIIEEDKKIEKIEICTSGIMGFDGVENITSTLKNKMNELIDEVNKLKEGKL